jgi:hypothetical protein
MFMFLDLPEGVKQMIFGKLLATDRIRFNVAMPQGEKMTITAYTTPERTKKLGLLEYYYRKRGSLNEIVLPFLLKNRQEPSARFLLEVMTAGTGLGEPAKQKIQIEEHDAIMQLIQEMCEGRFNPASIAALDYIEKEEFQRLREQFVDIILSKATVSVFQRLVSHSKGNAFVCKHVFANLSMFFTMVNCGNRSLLSYILANRYQWPKVDWDTRVEYVLQPATLDILINRLECIKIYVEVLHLPYDEQVRILEHAILTTHVSIVDYLMNEAKVSL